MTLKRTLYLLPVVLFSLAYGQVNAFQIAGCIKTQSKEKGETQQQRYREVRVDVKSKVLELKIRRINPTVGENVTVYWAVWKKTREWQNGHCDERKSGDVHPVWSHYGIDQ